MRVIAVTICFFAIMAGAREPFGAPTVLLQGREAAKANTFAERAAAQVDKLFAEWNRSDSPGCSLAISQNGVVVYEHGYGMANLELGTPITPASVFHVASISKQFTAMCILLLAQRGKLSLDDEVRKYITELPDYGNRLTIRHLLTHTSGLRDAFVLQGLAAPRDDGGDINDALVKLVARQRELNFPPGTDFQYNNGGYVLLATTVKRVGGQTLGAFADTNIFKPLGMTHTHFHDDPTMIVPNRASGYSGDASRLYAAGNGDTGGIVGNAGLFTTARDLLLWEQNFADVRVGAPTLLAEMQKPTILTGGETVPYGFGLEVSQYRGLRTVGHGGSDRGFVAYVVRYPDQRLAIAVLSNLDSIGSTVSALTQGVADIYLADAFPPTSANKAVEAESHVSLSADELASKAGLYLDLSNESVGRMFVRDGKLRASADASENNSIELTPVSASRFVLIGTPLVVEFRPVTPGRLQEVLVTGDGPKPKVMQRVSPFAPSSTELRAFIGDYTSPELDVTYKLTLHNASLVVRMPGRADVPLRPIFRDAFAGAGVNIVKFSRDRRGVVAGFTVNANGARGLRFARVNR